MFHCLDLLSQPESCEQEKKKKKKKELIELHSLLIPLNFALSVKENIKYIVNLCLSKNKTKTEKTKHSRFCKCLFMITIKKTVFWTPSVP